MRYKKWKVPEVRVIIKNIHVKESNKSLLITVLTSNLHIIESQEMSVSKMLLERFDLKILIISGNFCYTIILNHHFQSKYNAMLNSVLIIQI